MNWSKLTEHYIGLCWRHNCEPDESVRSHQSAHAHGFVTALNVASSGSSVGRMLMMADLELINRGVDRPMCGGMLLDIEDNGPLAWPDDVPRPLEFSVADIVTGAEDK